MAKTWECEFDFMCGREFATMDERDDHERKDHVWEEQEEDDSDEDDA